MRSILLLYLIFICSINSCCSGTEEVRPYSCYDDVVPNSESNVALIRSGNHNQTIEELSGQYEGDMVLSAQQRQSLVEISNRNGIRNESYRWPNKEVVYDISTEYFDLEQMNYIEDCIKILHEISCITFRRKTNNDVNYIHVTGLESGCYSNVGYRGQGVQVLNLSNATQPGAGCLRNGTILHEFLHSLGFYHQQSASERDSFVTIQWTHIANASLRNFVKYSENAVTNFNTLYDYGSVMHYSQYAFSTDGEPTIVPVNPRAVIGQRTHLSDLDILKLNRMYNCK